MGFNQNILTPLLLLMLSLPVSGQDTIVTMDGQVFIGKVISRERDIVKFLNENNPEGPSYEYESKYISQIIEHGQSRSYSKQFSNSDPFTTRITPVTLRKQSNIPQNIRDVVRKAALYQNETTNYRSLDTTPQGIVAQKVFLRLVESANLYLEVNEFQRLKQDLDWELSYVGCLSDEQTPHHPRDCPFVKEYGIEPVSAYHSLLNNAWASGYGKIVLGSSFCSSLTEEELASVIAHEMGHNIANHVVQKYYSNQKSIKLSETLALVYGIKYGDYYGALQNMHLIFDLALHKPHSRKSETEADMIGAVLVTLAGYNPQSTVDFWSKRINVSGSSYFNYESTHPTHLKRALDLQDFINTPEFDHQCEIRRLNVPPLRFWQTPSETDSVILNSGEIILCRVNSVHPYYIKVSTLAGDSDVIHKDFIAKIRYKNGVIEDLEYGRDRLGMFNESYFGRRKIEPPSQNKNVVFYGVDFSNFKISSDLEHADRETLINRYFNIINNAVFRDKESFDFKNMIENDSYFENKEILKGRNRYVDPYAIVNGTASSRDAQDVIWTYNPTMNDGTAIVILMDSWVAESGTFHFRIVEFDINSMYVTSEHSLSVKNGTSRWTDACIKALEKGWKSVKKQKR